MSTTLFPVSQEDCRDGPECEPVHSVLCKRAGADPADPEAGVVRLHDDSALRLCSAFGARVPPCDQDEGWIEGNVYAVFSAHGATHVPLYFVPDGATAEDAVRL